MYYRHNLDYQYPEHSDEHMITVKHLRDTNFDENFPYLEKGFWHKVKRVALWICLNTFVFPIVSTRYGLKIQTDRLRGHSDRVKAPQYLRISDQFQAYPRFSQIDRLVPYQKVFFYFQSLCREKVHARFQNSRY